MTLRQSGNGSVMSWLEIKTTTTNKHSESEISIIPHLFGKLLVFPLRVSMARVVTVKTCLKPPLVLTKLRKVL